MRWFMAILGFAVLVTAAPAAASDIPAPVWKAYRQAIKDAEQVDRDEIASDLVRLTRSDRRVQWRIIDGRRYVLMATLRRNAISDVPAGQPFVLSSSKWTVIPRQALNRCDRVDCQSMGSRKLDLTLKQLIGLPPDADYHVANTFWARPRDVFRPCRQPDVRASSCPRRALGPLPVIDGISVRTFLKEQAAYAWRMPRRWDPASAVSCASSWPEPKNCYGFPWTRLGYTYNWAPKRNEIGLTEFVVAEGATVYLQKVTSQREFVRERLS
jgi:hypothetical protein